MMLRLILGTVALGAVLWPQAAEEAALPSTEGKTLAGKAIVLAAELRGKDAVPVVTFSRAAGDAAQVWNRHLEGKVFPRAGTAFYQVSMLEDVPRLLRGMVIRGIKSGVPASRHATFVVLTQDEDAWKKAVGHKDNADPYIVGVDAKGAIRWQIAGPFTDARLQQLLAQIK